MSRKRKRCPGPVPGVACRTRQPIGPRGGACPACTKERVQVINWRRRNAKTGLPPSFRRRPHRPKVAPKPKSTPSRYPEDVLKARMVQSDGSASFRESLKQVDAAIRSLG